VECCRDGCPSGRFFHLHRPLGYVQFGWATSSRKSLGGSKLLLFENDGGPLCSWGPSMLQKCVGTLLQTSSQSCLGAKRTIPSTSFLGFCSDNCGTLYRQVCAFLNHVQSIEFTTGGLQSSCWNISRMINGNRMQLSSISSLIAKGLNTYVNKVFLFLVFNTFANI
jgi:hypothetical protein